MTSTPPVLLTSSVIAFDTSVKLKDETLRIKYTLESIENWLKISRDIQLVICDGSGFDFSTIVKKKFPGVRIECIYFYNDKNLVSLYGKGFGEGQIIKYALNHSVTLEKAPCFVKCTAKLWVNNFHKFLAVWNGNFLCHAHFSNVFSIRKIRLDYIDTRFYFVDKEFYRKYLLDAHHNIDDLNGSGIEGSFLKKIIDNNLGGVFMRFPPAISGMGGGSGLYYKDSMFRKLKDWIRVKIVLTHKVYSPLFFPAMQPSNKAKTKACISSI